MKKHLTRWRSGSSQPFRADGQRQGRARCGRTLTAAAFVPFVRDVDCLQCLRNVVEVEPFYIEIALTDLKDAKRRLRELVAS